MSMGNYLSIERLSPSVMAARNQPVGLDHLTVVPTNFEGETEGCSDCDTTPCTC